MLKNTACVYQYKNKNLKQA